MITKDQQLAFVPISSIKQAIEPGNRPIHFGEVVALIGRFVEENNRLKTENERLWKIAEKGPGASIVVVQTPQPAAPVALPASDQDEMRRASRMMLLQRLLAPQGSQSLNVYVKDCSRFPALCVH
jgi:regulator of replication initiation timing